MCHSITKAEKHGCELKSPTCHFIFFFRIFHQGSISLCLELTMQRKQKTLLAFLTWKHCYRDVWKVSSWFHRQRFCKYELLQPGMWSWECAGCFMCAPTALCVLNPQQEKDSDPSKAIWYDLGQIHNTEMRAGGGALRYWWHTSQASTSSAAGLDRGITENKQPASISKV